EGADRERYLSLWTPMTEAVFSLVTELGGSIAAEHGVGQMKRDALKHYKSEVELDMMRAIKKALDPKGILNPGKVL
ncbi:MAG: FAD-linked oxidase C-terminal domain-containing protein, partial [Hyphomicrobium sp.]